MKFKYVMKTTIELLVTKTTSSLLLNMENQKKNRQFLIVSGNAFSTPIEIVFITLYKHLKVYIN